jgi:pyrroloquinoline-quinone synthase
MELRDQLDAIVRRWDLLEHPFYQSWRAGRLPLETLQRYASEYGAVVSALPRGWSTLGADETVREEWEHVKLWDSFASALGTNVGDPMNPQTIELISACDRLFAEADTALGALYAFEAQQPATAASKLEGMRLHYDLSAASETYFDAHIRERREMDDLLARMQELGQESHTRVLAACESMCLHLWNALEGFIPTKVEILAAQPVPR